ncbi:IS5 family transposase [Neolewinella aurantiaca]|uniref:IS5 family transposase n=1 Tax=Neolewinella aurantiaca TaxID=2602767 RepID=A0A5C7FS65_9BACT|nr:IS5 family transposase [Neolewinella aurantiaca]
MLWLVRTGTQWRNLPDQFPPYRSVFYHFNKWSKNGTIETLNDGLNRLERKVVHDREDSPSLLLVDAQSVRLTPMIGTHRGIDGGKWVNGRKRSILTDTLGRTWRVNVHAANIHDGIAGRDLVYPDFRTQMPRAAKVLGDNAYRGQFADLMNQLDTVVFECPSRPEGSKGFVVEAKRWVVERSFAWMNFYRRITKDLEQTIENSASFILMANIQMVLSSIQKKLDSNF